MGVGGSKKQPPRCVCVGRYVSMCVCVCVCVCVYLCCVRCVC